MNRLKAIRAREDAATPGPWLYSDGVYKCWVDSPDANLHLSFQDMHPSDGHEWPARETAQFIANSRADIPLLLAVAEAAAELSPGEWQTIRIALQKMRFTPDRVLAALDHIDAAIAPLMEETE